jgi:multisubunit Na+/H+ antiporter MnhF subunit
MNFNPVESLLAVIVWLPFFLIYVMVLIFMRLIYGRNAAARMMGVELITEDT